MIKVFEMFSGFGGTSFALKKANINFECVGISEIDKYAIQCFNQNFPNIKNYGDCTKINPNDLPDFDLLTGGFPCPSFSIAGKGLGELDPRGNLFYEIIRIAEIKKPKFMLLENVKGLTNKPHKKTFEKILSELKRIGYDIYWKVLNSKEYGIPQNRERIFFVCKLGSWEFNEFQFPEKEELKILLKDILELEVDLKYYLSEEQIKRLIKRNSEIFNNKIVKFIDNKNKDTAKCINTSFTLTGSGRNCGSNQIIQLNNPKHSNDRIYLSDGCSPTLNSMGGGNRQPFICTIDIDGNKITNTPKIGQADRIYNKDGIIPSLNSSWTPQIKDSIIRKLTPKECFRLMGFLNDEINLDGLSNTQKYKLAGNGFEINVVSKIFKQMFK